MRYRVQTFALALLLCLALAQMPQNLPSGTKFLNTLGNLQAFLVGFQVTKWVPNAILCTNRVWDAGIAANQSSFFANITDQRWFEKTLNWTDTISDPIASAFQECATDLYLGFNVAKYNYNRFGSKSEWIQSFLQNMLGSVFSLQAILEDIVAAGDSPGKADEYYYMGLLLFYLMDFQPISEDLDGNLLLLPENFCDEPVTILRQDGNTQTTEEIMQKLSFMLQGFFIATIGPESRDQDEFLSYIDLYFINLGYLKLQWRTSRFYDWIDIMTVLIELIDPTVESFLWMISNYNKAFITYGATFSDPKRILFNIIYHFGSIYDGTKALVRVISANPNVALDIDDFYEIGGMSGYLFYQIFYDIEDYEYPDITVVYPEVYEQDE